tara:strand:- start:849 stop:1058 length:210 start_codon:yes stop_codon:yes gene_type:complete
MSGEDVSYPSGRLLFRTNGISDSQCTLESVDVSVFQGWLREEAAASKRGCSEESDRERVPEDLVEATDR